MEQLTWKDWVKAMLHGRATTFYVYIFLIIINAYGEFYFGGNLVLRELYYISSIFVIGGLVDTVAHLFLGKNQPGLDVPSLNGFIHDIFSGRTHLIYGLIGGLLVSVLLFYEGAFYSGLGNFIGGLYIIGYVFDARYYH